MIDRKALGEIDMKPVGFLLLMLTLWTVGAFLFGFAVAEGAPPARACEPSVQLAAIQQKLDRVEAILVQHWGK
jgi:hypothetical protein